MTKRGYTIGFYRYQANAGALVKLLGQHGIHAWIVPAGRPCVAVYISRKDAKRALEIKKVAA